METPKQNPEFEWIAASRQGDSQAFGKLVEKYQREVYGLLFRLSGNDDMAEDIAQDTFVTVWEKLSSFQERGPFRAWLFRIALNKLRSFWRRKKILSWLSLDHLKEDGQQSLEETLADPFRDSDPANSMEDPHLQKQINEALRLLPSRQREVIVLRAQDMEIHEIASILGVAEGTIKAHLFEAKKKLQQQLQSLLSS
ncbi:MAG: RNA polymerase sigma factor [Elusimicrobia bacterium]|nr:RNA polymerase sigma factor [Elusimicrobiota bacterium]